MEKEAKSTNNAVTKATTSEKKKYKVVGLKTDIQTIVYWKGEPYNLADLDNVPDKVLEELVASKYPHLIAE